MKCTCRPLLYAAAASGGAAVLGSAAQRARDRRRPSVFHRPSIHTRFPDAEPWMQCGLYERYPVWPFPGDARSFLADEWTAFYRFTGVQGSVRNDPPGFYQIFVCKGALDLPMTGELKTGDFIASRFSDTGFEDLAAVRDTVLVVKRQREPIGGGALKHAADYSYFKLPFFSRDESGLQFDVRSAFLLGTPFRTLADDRTVVTQLERFLPGTVAPSHFHAAPVWHEFVYLQGGQLTPDAFYAPGDHIVSIPGCKEGPYLSCFDNRRELPNEWPQYADRSALKRPFNDPWPKIFNGENDGIYGLLFVHHGPFARFIPWHLVNWTRLKARELGPAG